MKAMNYVFKLGLSLLTHLRRQDFPVLDNKPLDRMELHSRGPYLLTCLNSTSSSSLLHGPFFISSNSLSIISISVICLFLRSTHHFHLYIDSYGKFEMDGTYFCSCVVRLMGTPCTCAREKRYDVCFLMFVAWQQVDWFVFWSTWTQCRGFLLPTLRLRRFWRLVGNMHNPAISSRLNQDFF